MQSRFITWNWGKVDQDANPRYLQPTDLVKLINCVRDKDGRLSARGGVAKTVINTTTGPGAVLYSPGAPVTMEASPDTVIYRDASQNFWVRDESSGAVRFAGGRETAYPSWFNVGEAGTKASRRPLAVKTGNEIWFFSLGQTNQYQRTIFTAAGEVIDDARLIQAIGIVSYAVTVDNAGAVCLVYVTGSTDVVMHRFTNANQASGAATTWRSEAGAAFIGIDVANDATNNRLIVVAQSSKDSGGDRISGVLRSIGAPSGGVATSSSFTTSTGVGASGKEGSFGISILQDSAGFTSGFYYLVFFQQHTGIPGSTQVRQQKVTLGTPGTAVDTAIETFTMTNGLATGSCVGALIGGVPELLYTFQDLFSTHKMIQPNALIVRYCINAGTPTTLWRSSSVASKPWFVTGRGWFVAVHFNDWDDDGTGGRALEQNGAQNAYYVHSFKTAAGSLNKPGNYACGVLEGDAQAVSFFGTLTNGFDHVGADRDAHAVTPVDLGSSRVGLPLLSQGSARTRPSRIFATIDHNPSLYSTAPGIVPGGAVATIGAKEPLCEASPLVGPYSNYKILGTGAGGYTGTHFLTFCYAFPMSNGDVKLSPPYNLGPVPVAESWAGIASVSLNLPTLRHGTFAGLGTFVGTFSPLNPGQIWIYGSADGEIPMYFQDAIFNDPTVDAVPVTVYPQNWKAGNTPALPTTGGGLPYVSPPAARVAWQQGARIMLACCDGEIWQSFEKRPGRAPSWNPVLNFTLPEGAGEATGGCELDANSSAIFTATGTYISTGNPDERGTGGTTVATASTSHGCTNPASIARGQLGVYFADQNGRMCVLASGAVQDIAAGMIDYKAKTWVSAVDCPTERLIRWQASDGTRLTLQYAYLPKDGSAPWGTWVPETGLGLPTSVVGARLIDGVHVALDSGATPNIWSPGSNYYDGTSATPVLINWKTGKNSPAGFMTSFDLDQFLFSATRLGGNCTYDVTITSDGTAGSSEVHHVDASTEPDFGFRASVFRAREFDVEVQQVTSTGAGHLWDGIVAEVKTDAKVRPVTPSRMIP